MDFLRGVRDDIDQEDDEESYYRYLEENPTAGLIGDEEELDVEYDADGNVILPETKKVKQGWSPSGTCVARNAKCCTSPVDMELQEGVISDSHWPTATDRSLWDWVRSFQ